MAAEARAAFQEGSLGFGFSAGGLLFPYYCGVVQEVGGAPLAISAHCKRLLQRALTAYSGRGPSAPPPRSAHPYTPTPPITPHPLQLTRQGIIKDGTPMAGASAGSLIAACARSGLPMSTIIDACWELADDCRAKGTRTRLGPVLRRVLDDLLPEDFAEAISGRTHVAVTAVLPRGGPPLQPALVSQFEDREDAIQALMTSCHIPLYMDGSLTTRFRGTPHFDGGITNFLPAPPTAGHTVRVCCLPSQQLRGFGGIAISPDLYTDWPYTVREMLAWAFEPADQGLLEELVGRGEADAAAWAAESGVGALAAAERAPRAGGLAGAAAALRRLVLPM